LETGVSETKKNLIASTGLLSISKQRKRFRVHILMGSIWNLRKKFRLIRTKVWNKESLRDIRVWKGIEIQKEEK